MPDEQNPNKDTDSVSDIHSHLLPVIKCFDISSQASIIIITPFWSAQPDVVVADSNSSHTIEVLSIYYTTILKQTWGALH